MLVYRLAAAVRREATFRYLSEYLRSQWHSPETIAAGQRESIERLLDYLSLHIPRYTKLGGLALHELPIISKKEIKEQPELFAAKQPRGPLSSKTTGGSTGQPITIIKDREAMAREQAGTLRGYSWAGLRPGDRQARMWGVPSGAQRRAANELRDRLLNRRRFSAFNYTERELEAFHREFLKFKPAYIYGYVSMVRDFANFVGGRAGRASFPWLKAIVTTSEVLSDAARTEISAAFGVRVYNEYGCGEVGTIAHECEQGAMHITAENLIVEVLDEGGSATAGDGRLVITELHNRAQPLVRYELGDYGRLGDAACPCGRQLPILENIHGRAYDIIVGPQGRKYHPEFFIYIFEDLKRRSESIAQFQLVQRNEQLEIALVRGKEFDETVEHEIVARLTGEFGDYFSYSFRHVDAIEREPSGKLRVVKRVQPEQLHR